MYNEEAKRKYLEELGKEYSQGYISTFRVAFNKIEPYEDFFKKDVSIFSKEEILYSYEKLNISYSTMKNFNVLFRKYTLETTGKIGAYDLSDPELREHFPERMEIKVSYMDIQRWVSLLINPVDKFVLYGLFYGIKGNYYSEIACSSMEDCDEKSQTIWLADAAPGKEPVLKSRKIKVNKELYEYAVESSQAKYYIQETQNGIRKKVPIKTNGKLILQIPSTDGKGDDFLSKINRRLKIVFEKACIPKNIKVADIYWSGVTFHLKQKALEQNLTINDPMDFLKLTNINEVEEQYGLKLTKRRLKDKVGRYM